MKISKPLFFLFVSLLSFTWYSCEEVAKKTEKAKLNEGTTSISEISDEKMSEILTSIAINLEANKLEYNNDLGHDASGIFHVIKDSLQSRVPDLAEGEKYIYPAFNRERITRQIADWYYKNDNLIIVEDALASRNSIRPGSVMFFGKSGETFENINIEILTDRNNNHSIDGAITHMAVVNEVSKDDEGNVIGYTMMHGRRPGRIASRSSSKEIQSVKTKGLPPFGNWKQQWVAMANIVTSKK